MACRQTEGDTMSASRDYVLGNLRRGLGRGGDNSAAEHAVEERLNRHASGPVPERGRKERAERIELFMAEAGRVDVSIDKVTAVQDVPRAIAAYLAKQNLPSAVKISPDPGLSDIPWDSQPTLEANVGPADADDGVAVTGAYRGVAETGTLLLLSGPDTPTSMNFLPDTHVVVMSADQIIGSFEEVWADMRAGGADFMPRAVNWITGPSRSGDIEQTLLLGAHGPRRLHLVLIDEQGV
jgi:L-lactate dehydrogenase complex protein LldG